MEDEQGCSGSTPTYCRADQFRCGTTCIPNVSGNKMKRNFVNKYFISDRLGVVMVIEVKYKFNLEEILFE
jgi:hypothetical protein